jgi:hypothetical protein
MQMGAMVDGVWVYNDPEQTRIAAMALDALGWDLAAFDEWVYGNQHWRNFPKARQTLMNLRAQLTFALRAKPQARMQAVHILRDYFHEICQQVTPLKNVPEPLKASMTAVKHRIWPLAGTRLDTAAIRRIQRAHKEMLASGQGYGAQQQLAEQHGVSVTTIKRVLNLKPGSRLSPGLPAAVPRAK